VAARSKPRLHEITAAGPWYVPRSHLLNFQVTILVPGAGQGGEDICCTPMLHGIALKRTPYCCLCESCQRVLGQAFGMTVLALQSCFDCVFCGLGLGAKAQE